jgi:hypothetical protein
MLMFKYNGVRGLRDSLFEAGTDGGSGTLAPLKQPSLPSGLLPTSIPGGSAGGSISVASGGFFPQPSTGGFMPGGFMMPGMPTPGMPTPGLMPGMPGYVPPTPWYSGPIGLILLAGGALLAFKLLSD